MKIKVDIAGLIKEFTLDDKFENKVKTNVEAVIDNPSNIKFKIKFSIL